MSYALERFCQEKCPDGFLIFINTVSRLVNLEARTHSEFSTSNKYKFVYIVFHFLDRLQATSHDRPRI